jgi:hypothetical protein
VGSESLGHQGTSRRRWGAPSSSCTAFASEAVAGGWPAAATPLHRPIPAFT